MVNTEFSLVRFKGDKDKAEDVYRGMQPMVAEDIADCVLWALTRPLHVNVDEIVVKATQQASGARVHRNE
jgi:NADP-dependent 3-hydroxy acid dehydrogenase YdfG